MAPPRRSGSSSVVGPTTRNKKRRNVQKSCSFSSTLSWDDIDLGNELGSGKFSSVFEIDGSSCFLQQKQKEEQEQQKILEDCCFMGDDDDDGDVDVDVDDAFGTQQKSQRSQRSGSMRSGSIRSSRPGSQRERHENQQKKERKSLMNSESFSLINDESEPQRDDDNNKNNNNNNNNATETKKVSKRPSTTAMTSSNSNALSSASLHASGNNYNSSSNNLLDQEDRPLALKSLSADSLLNEQARIEATKCLSREVEILTHLSSATSYRRRRRPSQQQQQPQDDDYNDDSNNNSNKISEGVLEVEEEEEAGEDNEEEIHAAAQQYIIKLHAVSDNFWDNPSTGFIVLERLSSILDGRIKQWTSRAPPHFLRKLSQPMGGGGVGGPRALVAMLWNGNRRNASSKNISGNKFVQLQTNRTTNIAIGLARAMNHIHRHKIMYRDLKPHNIGFDDNDQIKVFDFGLARFVPRYDDGFDDVDGRRLTRFVGTLRYMAPEVMAGRSDYSYPVDAYSYGIVLWETYTLQKCFDKAARVATSKEHYRQLILGHKYPIKLHFMASAPSLRQLVTQCVDGNPQRRPTFAAIQQQLMGNQNSNNSLANENNLKNNKLMR